MTLTATDTAPGAWGEEATITISVTVPDPVQCDGPELNQREDLLNRFTSLVRTLMFAPTQQRDLSEVKAAFPNAR